MGENRCVMAAVCPQSLHELSWADGSASKCERKSGKIRERMSHTLHSASCLNMFAGLMPGWQTASVEPLEVPGDDCAMRKAAK